jgi:hypothetical protein
MLVAENKAGKVLDHGGSLERARSLFPGAPSLQPGMRLWALLNADGTPIVLTDSRAAAVANAEEHDLQTVSVH